MVGGDALAYIALPFFALNMIAGYMGLGIRSVFF